MPNPAEKSVQAAPKAGIPMNPPGMVLQQTIFQGPIPAPEYLRQYAEIIPDAPQRFFGLVEREQEHRHQQDRWTKLIATVGMLSGVLLGFSALGVAAYLGMNDKLTLGFGGFFVGVSALIGTVIWGRKRIQKPKEPEAA